MADITKDNIEIKINDMSKLMQLWACRNITPLGRVTVLKSLILSKIVHVLQSLPSPDKETLKVISKMCVDFVWKKRHEVNKVTLCMDWDNGGLNMGYITEFDMSLKLTWLRKLLQQSLDWIEFAVHYKLDRLIWIGTTYHDKLQNTISNPFWKSVSISF